MARTTYVYRDGQLIEAHLAPPLITRFGSGPAVISDHVSPCRSMADGRVYDSKSAHARAAREAGCSIIGNDRAAIRTPEFKSSGVGHDIKRAIQELS